MVDIQNIPGHEARLKGLLQSQSRNAALEEYVGGGQRYSIGHREKEAIAKYHDLRDARIVDIGCGIGRLTQALANEPIGSYLGTDILPEMLAEARETVNGDPRFEFALVKELDVPTEDASVDIACAFSVITHLTDEQVFAYFAAVARVLRPGGIAVFSYLDFSHPRHRPLFLQFARDPGAREDVLKFFEKDTLGYFAEIAGLTVLEFQDAYTRSPAKFPGVKLPDGSWTGDALIMGQSLLFMRKPG